MRSLLHFYLLSCMTTVLLSAHVSSPDEDKKSTTTSAPDVNSVVSWETTQRSLLQDQDSHSGFKITIQNFKNPSYMNGRYDCKWSSSTNMRKSCSGWIHLVNTSYYVWQHPVEWEEAVDLCRTINSTLFVPNTVEEMDEVFDEISPEMYWIGLQKESEQEQAHWIEENGIELSKLRLMNGTSFVTYKYLRNYGNAKETEEMCGAVVPFVDEEYKLRTLMYPCYNYNAFICKGNRRQSFDECHKDSIYHNSTCYPVFTSSDWKTAVDQCQEINSTLFVPRTVEEMNGVFKKVSPGIYWIGLQRDRKQEQAHWNQENGMDLSELILIDGSSTSIHSDLYTGTVTEKTCNAVFPFVINKELKLRTFMFPCHSNFHFICKGNTRQSEYECDFGSIYHNETCYYADNEPLTATWEEAVEKCQRRNSTLFIPSSIEEMNAVFEQVSYEMYWIGISGGNKQQQAHWNEEIASNSPEIILTNSRLPLTDRYLETDGNVMGSEKTCGAAMSRRYSRLSALMYPCNNLNYFVCKATKESLKHLLKKGDTSEFFMDLHL